MVRRPRNERGITLVELMVVVAILAVLAGLVISLYQDVQKKSRLAADQATAAASRSAVAIYFGKHNGNFPDNATMYVLTTPSPPIFQCTGGTVTVNANSGLVTYTPNDIASC